MIEAGVGCGEAIGGGPVTGDNKWGLQGSQPLDWNAVGARDKKQQPLLLLLAEAVHDVPEPPDHLPPANHPLSSYTIIPDLRSY